MKRMASAAAISLVLVFGAPGTVSADPGGSGILTCPGGHLVRRAPGAECPPYPRNPISVAPGGGGGPGRGGGLIGTIGRVLGGLTGGLLG